MPSAVREMSYSSIRCSSTTCAFLLYILYIIVCIIVIYITYYYYIYIVFVGGIYIYNDILWCDIYSSNMMMWHIVVSLLLCIYYIQCSWEGMAPWAIDIVVMSYSSIKSCIYIIYIIYVHTHTHLCVCDREHLKRTKLE